MVTFFNTKPLTPGSTLTTETTGLLSGFVPFAVGVVGAIVDPVVSALWIVTVFLLMVTDSSYGPASFSLMTPPNAPSFASAPVIVAHGDALVHALVSEPPLD